MDSKSRPPSSGENDTQPEGEAIQGEPWQEDEVWEAAGPGVVPTSESLREGSAEELRSEGRAAADRAAQSARELGRMAAQKGAQARRQIREFGSRAVAEQKTKVADEVGNVSTAIRKAADKLHAERDENLAEYAEAAAEHLDRMERYLRTRPLDAMYGDLQSFARRRPEMVVGGMFVAGVALSRFLKASRPEPHSRLVGPYDTGRVAAGPLVSPTGEPLTPPHYPPSRSASELATPTDLILPTPEVE